MSQPGKKLKKKQKRKLRKIFFSTILITLAVIGIAVGAFVFIYNNSMLDNSGILDKKVDEDPINKTVAVFGVDEDGYRTDVIFVVNFNSATGRTRIISVPRDTKVEWTDEMQTEMEAIKGYSVSVSKINEMTSYVGIENIKDFTIQEIEDITGLQIDNYVIVTIDAFKQIVDDIGGVEVDVPALNGDGLHYDDNAQDLHIHLNPGLQTLNGEQAEGLMRFRKGYAEGDLGRIKTQQIFLEAFAKKIASPEIITKLPAIATTVMQTVTTDVTLSEALGYIPYLKNLNPNDLKSEVLPGEPKYEGGKAYFIVDEVAMPTFINEALYGATEDETSGEAITIDYNVSIEILNSTGKTGLASQEKERLEANSYTVSQIGNYTAGELQTTVIYAKDTALAKQFVSYYPNATIEYASDISYDIQIVLGNDVQKQEG